MVQELGAQCAAQLSASKQDEATALENFEAEHKVPPLFVFKRCAVTPPVLRLGSSAVLKSRNKGLGAN
jgi:hypothetical protein